MNPKVSAPRAARTAGGLVNPEKTEANMNTATTELKCPSCAGEARRDRPDLAIDARCTKCGWHFSTLEPEARAARELPITHAFLAFFDHCGESLGFSVEQRTAIADASISPRVHTLRPRSDRDLSEDLARRVIRGNREVFDRWIEEHCAKRAEREAAATTAEGPTEAEARGIKPTVPCPRFRENPDDVSNCWCGHRDHRHPEGSHDLWERRMARRRAAGVAR